MALLEMKNISLGYGDPLLLSNINFLIHPGERICILGRNGCGKTTMIRLLLGEIRPDKGDILRKQGIRLSGLAQEVPHDIEVRVFDVVAGGLGDVADCISEYHRISRRLEDDHDPALMDKLHQVEEHLANTDGWRLHQKVTGTLSRLNLDADEPFETLSAGMKRRVFLAKALVSEPDVLFLDEPTNHLDIASITWLEAFLQKYAGTLVFVSHDREFLKKLAGRVVEIERGRLLDWFCDYDTFLKKRAAAIEAEEKGQALFDKRLDQEEAWIRQGIKARRTRNMGRVRALEKMREIRRARRSRTGNVTLSVQEAEQSGKLVIEAENITYRYEDAAIIKDFSIRIMRGDKVGVIGPNGAGKTTLLNILLKNIPPTLGTVRHGTRLQVAYFDQLREQLDENRTVQDNVADGKEMISFNNSTRHVIGYLKDFLFSPQRARSPVKMLSGGERNRLLLARLFSKPSNLLVLDEPTNDLDAETLELLEELLFDYPGTVLLVSHDRAFLNNVVTSTLVFESQGRISEYVGGYDDWLRCKENAPADETVKKAVKTEKSFKKTIESPRKLTFKEKRELEELPKKIEELESLQEALYAEMADPVFYQKAGSDIAAVKAGLETVTREIEDTYKRWEELEDLQP